MPELVSLGPDTRARALVPPTQIVHGMKVSVGLDTDVPGLLRFSIHTGGVAGPSPVLPAAVVLLARVALEGVAGGGWCATAPMEVAHDDEACYSVDARWDMRAVAVSHDRRLTFPDTQASPLALALRALVEERTPSLATPPPPSRPATANLQLLVASATALADARPAGVVQELMGRVIALRSRPPPPEPASPPTPTPRADEADVVCTDGARVRVRAAALKATAIAPDTRTVAAPCDARVLARLLWHAEAGLVCTSSHDAPGVLAACARAAHALMADAGIVRCAAGALGACLLRLRSERCQEVDAVAEVLGACDELARDSCSAQALRRADVHEARMACARQAAAAGMMDVPGVAAWLSAATLLCSHVLAPELRERIFVGEHTTLVTCMRRLARVGALPQPPLGDAGGDACAALDVLLRSVAMGDGAVGRWARCAAACGMLRLAD